MSFLKIISLNNTSEEKTAHSPSPYFFLTKLALSSTCWFTQVLSLNFDTESMADTFAEIAKQTCQLSYLVYDHARKLGQANRARLERTYREIHTAPISMRLNRGFEAYLNFHELGPFHPRTIQLGLETLSPAVFNNAPGQIIHHLVLCHTIFSNISSTTIASLVLQLALSTLERLISEKHTSSAFYLREFSRFLLSLTRYQNLTSSRPQPKPADHCLPEIRKDLRCLGRKFEFTRHGNIFYTNETSFPSPRCGISRYSHKHLLLLKCALGDAINRVHNEGYPFAFFVDHDHEEAAARNFKDALTYLCTQQTTGHFFGLFESFYKEAGLFNRATNKYSLYPHCIGLERKFSRPLGGIITTMQSSLGNLFLNKRNLTPQELASLTIDTTLFAEHRTIWHNLDAAIPRSNTPLRILYSALLEISTGKLSNRHHEYRIQYLEAQLEKLSLAELTRTSCELLNMLLLEFIPYSHRFGTPVDLAKTYSQAITTHLEHGLPDIWGLKSICDQFLTDVRASFDTKFWVQDLRTAQQKEQKAFAHVGVAHLAYFPPSFFEPRRTGE
jgi:hypothetical protein